MGSADRDAVAIIGAGSAGLVSAQALLARGIDVTVFEARDGIGGNWRYDPEPGRSSCYASLITNTSRWRTSLRSFRLPRLGSSHLRHDEMLAYLERFSAHFGIDRCLQLGTEVRSARRDGAGWEIETDEGRSRHSALIVATGYNSEPLLPAWPGELDGPILHTHDYRVPEPFVSRDVIVVGLGCSATELACEVATVARSVTLLARSARDVVPHKVGPLPVDLLDTYSGSRMPWSLRRRLVGLTSRLSVGDLTRYGLPQRDGPAGNAPIAVSQQLRKSLRSGRVRGATGSIERLAGDHVVLADGRELPAGGILAGTGYRARFDFLQSAIEAPSIERADLYRGIAHPAAEGLFFVGLVAGHGALLPMFEAQAAWVAAVLARELQIPGEETMRASIAADRRVRAANFEPRFGIFFDRLRYARHVLAEAARPGRAVDPAGPTHP